MDELNSVNPTQAVDTTTDQPSSEQQKVNEEMNNKGVSFDAQQQAKLNSLLKEEREKILRRLGLTSFEEAQAKLEKANKYDALESEHKTYKEKASKVEELVGENAMLKANVREDARDICVAYFKGKNIELNEKTLNEFFTNNPTIKSQWVGTPRQNVQIGNPQSDENKQSANGYAEWKKMAGLNRY